jgi:hypothetical protein
MWPPYTEKVKWCTVFAISCLEKDEITVSTRRPTDTDTIQRGQCHAWFTAARTALTTHSFAPRLTASMVDKITTHTHTQNSWLLLHEIGTILKHFSTDVSAMQREKYKYGPHTTSKSRKRQTRHAHARLTLIPHAELQIRPQLRCIVSSISPSTKTATLKLAGTIRNPTTQQTYLWMQLSGSKSD